MEIFNRRYLCMICFAFILTALGLTLFSGTIKLILGIVSAVALIVFVVFFIKTKKHKFISLFAVLVCFAVSLSAFSSYFFINRKLSNAESLVGENTVLVRIITEDYENEYNVRLLRVGDKEVNIKARLRCEIDEKLEYGDRLAMNADVDISEDIWGGTKTLNVSMLENSEVFLDKAEIKNYFSIDGIMALTNALQEKFSEHVDRTFGDHSALAKGLLVNDKSDIDKKTETDFKRSGTSHILAVSGMHIALLMGAVDLILRKVEVKKGARIVVISILSIFFLALTGFVASAVRSVLMLFAVYLCYILYEESDSLTALFASIAMIILFSPSSVYDLGMWMSFIATLGILTLYPYFDEKMPYPKQENLFVRYSLRLLIWIAKTLMLTLVANLFLLPIMWFFFGSVSISSLPCNLILTPIVTILMPLCAFTTLLGFIPYVHIPFVFITNKLFDVMMAIVEYFSSVRFGVISLRYEFAEILIILFAVSLAVLLVVKLKHKWIVYIPCGAFILAFAACTLIFNYTSTPTVQCARVYDSEIVFVSYASECNVIDTGKGGVSKGSAVVKYMSKYATEIDQYFIVDPDGDDAKTLNRVCENTVIRRILISKSLKNSDLSAYSEIFKCAEKYNIDVELYDYDNNVEICNGVSFNYNPNEGFSVASDSVRLKSQGEKIVFEYQNNIYDVPYKERLSTVIPLN